MSPKNIFSQPSKQEDAPIQEGDAVLIIRDNGEVIPMTFGIDRDMADSLTGMDPTDMTPEQVNLALKGQMLFLLTMAAKSDDIMEFLSKVSMTEGRNDLEKIQKAATFH